MTEGRTADQHESGAITCLSRDKTSYCDELPADKEGHRDLSVSITWPSEIHKGDCGSLIKGDDRLTIGQEMASNPFRPENKRADCDPRVYISDPTTK